MVAKPRIRLLLVDDDQVYRLVCRRALEQHPDCNYDIIEAETGKQGLKLARVQQPDCILLDYYLPDFNGGEFLIELARDSEKPPIPVVMLTGADNAKVAVDVLKLGASDFVVKGLESSYTMQWLQPVVHRALREHQAIQDKALAEQQLREAEAKYRKLVEQIPAVTYIASLEIPGKLLYLSPQIQQLGFPVEDWLAEPQGLFKRVHADDRQTTVEAYAQTYEHCAPLHCEYRLVKSDGQVRWFLDEANVVHDAVGNPLFLQGILVDITKDKENEQELAQYRLHLEELVAQRTEQLEQQNIALAKSNTDLFKALGDLKRTEVELRIAALAFESQAAIAVIDADKKLIRINQAYTRITGYSLKEAMFNNILNNKHYDTGHILGIWTDVERDGYWQGEVWDNRKDGEAIAIWLILNKITDQDRTNANYVATFTDITSQKQAEKILLEARERLQSQVASTQEELEAVKSETDEINTTLNVLLKHREKDKDEAQKSLSNEVETIVLPLIEKLRGASKNRRNSLRYVDMVEDSLKSLVKSYGRANHIDAAYQKLTNVETQVAAMVKLGKPTKVIASTLGIASGTVNLHRKHIRKKLGLDNKENLHGYLQSLSE